MKNLYRSIFSLTCDCDRGVLEDRVVRDVRVAQLGSEVVAREQRRVVAGHHAREGRGRHGDAPAVEGWGGEVRILFIGETVICHYEC